MGSESPVDGAVTLSSKSTRRSGLGMTTGLKVKMGVGVLTGMSAAPPMREVLGNSIVLRVECCKNGS